MNRKLLLCVILAVTLIFTSDALAQSSYSETGSGDLSNDGNTPTALSFSAGDNTVSGSAGQSTDIDRDYFTFTVPAGHELTSVVLESYENSLGQSFIAVSSGNTMTVDPTANDPTGLLGYTLFSPGDLDANLLPNIGTGSGATGFTGALPSGDYTFWVQETANVISYRLNFVITALPSVDFSSPYDESADGDLSNSGLTPTSIIFSSGNNSVTGMTGASAGVDRDYFTVTVPNGFELSAIELDAYDAIFGQSFIGVSTGNTMTQDPESNDPSGLLGYMLFGEVHLNTNVIETIGSGSGATGFTGPLPSGDYTFWIQETAADVNYSFNFVYTPLPISFSETDSGDLANDGNFPTPISLGVGSNIIAGSVFTGTLSDRDYFVVTIPEGHWISELNLSDFSHASNNNATSLYVALGTTIEDDPTAPDSANFIGTAPLDESSQNDNLLDDIGGALPAGQYTFWVEEGTGAATYEFELKVDAIPVQLFLPLTTGP